MHKLISGAKAHKLTPAEKLKGAVQSTQKKKMAAQLRELKKKGLSDAVAKETIEMMLNPDYSALQIIQRIQALDQSVGDTKTFQQSERLVNMISNFHKLHHGDKQINTVNNTQINILTDQDMSEILGRLKK